MKVRIIIICSLFFIGGCGDDPQTYWAYSTEEDGVEVGTDSDGTRDTGSTEEDETYEGYLDSETLWESATGWDSETQLDSETGSLSDEDTDSNEVSVKDECDFTSDCQAMYGPTATGCVNSKSDNSFCRCGLVPCRVTPGGP